MKIDHYSGLAMVKRILALIAKKGRSVVAIRKLSLVAAGAQESFRPAEIPLMNEKIQVAEFSQRDVPVHQLCQNGTFKGYDWNTGLLKYLEQPK